MHSPSIYFLLSIALIAISSSAAFTAMPTTTSRSVVSSSTLFMADGASEEVKAAPQVTGEQLEVMLQEWDSPLVIDAYATWYVASTFCIAERKGNRPDKMDTRAAAPKSRSCFFYRCGGWNNMK